MRPAMDRMKKNRPEPQKSVGFDAPLNPGDTDKETAGCRRNNPDTCMRNSLEGVCAFVRSDGICKAPPQSWPKQYFKLKGAE